jgi:hypothetical protein
MSVNDAEKGGVTVPVETTQNIAETTQGELQEPNGLKPDDTEKYPEPEINP